MRFCKLGMRNGLRPIPGNSGRVECYLAIKVLVYHHLQLKITNASLLAGLQEQNEWMQVQLDRIPIIYRIIFDEKSGGYEHE